MDFEQEIKKQKIHYTETKCMIKTIYSWHRWGGLDAPVDVWPDMMAPNCVDTIGVFGYEVFLRAGFLLEIDT